MTEAKRRTAALILAAFIAAAGAFAVMSATADNAHALPINVNVTPQA